jgi:hypothetical protein
LARKNLDLDSDSVIRYGCEKLERAKSEATYIEPGTVFQQTEQPPFIVPASELKQIRMLNVFEPCTLQIGDRNFYTLKDTDLVMTKTEWKRLERDQLSKGKAVRLKKVGYLPSCYWQQAIAILQVPYPFFNFSEILLFSSRRHVR